MDVLPQVISSSAAAGVTLVVDDIFLAPEPPYSTVFPQLLAWDLQPDSGPVFTGFTPLTSSQWYERGRGFGIAIGSAVWQVPL